MRTLLITLTLLSFSLTALAQHNLGVKAAGGLSKITIPSKLLSNGERADPFAFSGQGGFFYNYALGERSVLGAELLFTQIRGREKVELIIIPNEAFDYEIFYGNISYLSLPFYYGLMFNRFTVIIGIQPSLALGSSGRYKTTYINADGESETHKEKWKLNVKTFDFGPKIGLVFDFTEKLGVEGTYYYGINKIFDTKYIIQGSALPFGARDSKVRQLTIGLRYKLL